MKKSFCLLTIFFIFSGVFGQNYQKIDSLKQILKTLPELDGTDADTARMKIFMNIGGLFQNNIPDSTLFYYFLIADTSVTPENIKLYPKKARLNATTLKYIGIVAINHSNYSEAAFYYGLSLRIAEELGDKREISRCLMGLGSINYSQGNYHEACLYFKLSLKSFEELVDKIGISNCLIGLAMIAEDQGNYPEAVLYYERSLKIAEESGDRKGISNCLLGLGIISVTEGNYSEALSYYKRSLKIMEELGDRRAISNCLINLGNILKNQGNYPEAVSYYKQSLKISEELGEKSVISKCLTNLGNVLNEQGNFPEAVAYHENSLKISEDLGEKRSVSISLINLGNVAYNQGNYLKAVSYYERSLKISEELGDKRGVSKSCMNLGFIANIQGNYPKAVSYFERSLKISEELGDKRGISAYINNLGREAVNHGNYQEAISYFKRSLKILEELGDKQRITGCLNDLGSIYATQGNYQEAVSYFGSSLKILEELGNKAGLSKDYPKLAKIYIKTDRVTDALHVLLKSLYLTIGLLNDNFSIMSEMDKELYFEEINNVFNEINSFTYSYPEYNDSLNAFCYNNELILKGLLLKSTAGILDVVYNSPDTAIQNTYWLMKQYRDNISSLQGTEEANRDSLIANLEKKANEQERKLVKRSSEFAGIQKLFEYKWQDVQKNLKPDEAAIEFVSFTQGDKNDTTVYAALVITPESKMPVSIELFEDRELQKILGKSTGTGFNYVSSLYGANNNALYDLIWKPLEPALAGINTVYFAPVGVLNKISFAALTIEPGKMLCDIYNLQQVSTTGKLIKQEVKSELKMTAAVFGGIDYNPDTVKQEVWQYLPGTLNEKNSIEKQLKKNKITCRGFSGKDAKEEAFKELFAAKTNSPGILHISTHGFFYPAPELVRKEEDKTEESEIKFRGGSGFGNWMFLNNKNPMMRSGLVFTGANRVWGEDWEKTDNEGVLTAYEVSNLNMRNTDLVVLSACETGLGDICGSEGVYGLQRAFKMAGVKYIIMSLWQVPDKETSEFMETFYSKLLKIKDIRKSFNETQKEMRKKYDPYYWAAFVLIE